MPSNDIFSTYGASKQAEIITKLMELFRGNERFHGYGDIKGANKDEETGKWKFKEGTAGYRHRKLTEDDWRAHLSGERFIGISPIQDDNTVWFTCIDVDKTEDNVNYDFDYAQEMWKIKNSKLPLVVFRTKSGGLRVTLFFSEPIEAELAVRRMKQIAAQLGYAGQEIFPKQVKVEKDGYPNWIFIPYGPTANKFPDQCCMNESGNAMELYESVIHAMKKRITFDIFKGLFVEDFKAKANGRANGKKHPKGMFVWPENESYEDTVKTVFWDGPICLWHISLEKCPAGDQHYFLFNCGLFFMRKYPGDWEKVLEWVNYNVLRPTGDGEKLKEMIKDLKSKQDRQDRAYEYTCKNPPICNRCHAHACKQRPYGVGAGNGIDHQDLGLTITKRGSETIFTINVGSERVPMSAAEFKNVEKYREKCLAYATVLPPSFKKAEWERVIQVAIENAMVVEPPTILQKNAGELEMLVRFFDSHIPALVRSGRENDGAVAIREDEHRIYFKW